MVEIARGHLSDKERRNLDILEIIRKKSPVSRTDISKYTQLNIVTVSNYVDHYIKQGLVFEGGLDVSSGGRRPGLIELNPGYGYIVGIDCGPSIMCGALTEEGGYIDAVLVDFSAKIMAKVKERKVAETLEDFSERLIRVVRKVIDDAKVDKSRIKGVGLGVAGVVDAPTGTIRHPMPGEDVWNYLNAKDKFERELGVPVFVENDATAAIFGERWVGLSLEAGVENVLYICSDSGAGIMIKGDVFYGATGGAGELNLNPPKEDEINPERCWTQYSCCMRSHGLDMGVSSRARAILSDGKKKSKILNLAEGDLKKITFETVADAAKEGDALAIDLLEEAGEQLGVKVAYLVNVFNPETVIIGRGVEQGGEILLNAVRKAVKRWAFEEMSKTVKIIPTKLGEDSVAIGAASLVMQEIFARV